MNEQTEKLRDSLNNIWDSDTPKVVTDKRTATIIKICKDAGLVFLEARGSYGFEAEFEDIEL